MKKFYKNSNISIVKKYGFVPMQVMTTTYEGKNANRVTNLFSEIVRNNAIALLKLKQQNKKIIEIRKVKIKMLEENYEFLSKVYGEPVNTFDYEYINKNGDKIVLKDITPNQFVEKFLSIDIENFVFISNVPKKNRMCGEKLKNPQSININKMKYVEYLHISSEELKQLTIKQLKDNIPVMVGIYVKKFTDKDSDILDTRLYDYEKLLNYKTLIFSSAIKEFINNIQTNLKIYKSNIVL